MSPRSLALGASLLLLLPARAARADGWVNVPGQGWRYQVTIGAPVAWFGCEPRIVGGTCTPSGSSLLFTHGQERLTLTWQPKPASTVYIDPLDQGPTSNFVTVGTWKWTATAGFTFPPLEKAVVAPLFVAGMGGCSPSCWGMFYRGWHAPGNDRQVGISAPGTGVAFLYPNAPAHPETGYDRYLLFLQYTTPVRVVIDASMTEGAVDVSLQAVMSPEPSTFALLGGGVVILLGTARRRRRA